MPALGLCFGVCCGQAPVAPVVPYFLLLETGDFFLLESGDKMIL